jgi:hypothetical protein
LRNFSFTCKDYFCGNGSLFNEVRRNGKDFFYIHDYCYNCDKTIKEDFKNVINSSNIKCKYWDYNHCDYNVTYDYPCFHLFNDSKSFYIDWKNAYASGIKIF